jgi:precorrin-6B methylase 2
VTWIVRFELASSVGPEAETPAERISTALWELGTTGIAETQPDGGSDGRGESTLLAGFESESEARHAAGALAPDVAVVAATLEPVAPDGWVDDDRRGRLHLPTTTVDLAVGAAFGHGAHPTTRLAVDLVVSATTAGAAVLDFGTGTGILAIAAAATGATRIVAVDNDPAARAVAATNLEANAGSASVTITDRLPAPPGPFDLIAANVLLGVHQEHGRSLVDLLAPGGALIVSGVLAGQRDQTLAAYEGLTMVDERTAAGEPSGEPWLALRLVSSGAHRFQ